MEINLGEGTIVSSSLDWWYFQTPPPLPFIFYFNPFTEHTFGEYLLCVRSRDTKAVP